MVGAIKWEARRARSNHDRRGYDSLAQIGKGNPKRSTLDVVNSGSSIIACDKSDLLMYVSVSNGISSWFGYDDFGDVGRLKKRLVFAWISNHV